MIDGGFHFSAPIKARIFVVFGPPGLRFPHSYALRVSKLMSSRSAVTFCVKRWLLRQATKRSISGKRVEVLSVGFVAGARRGWGSVEAFILLGGVHLYYLCTE